MPWVPELHARCQAGLGGEEGVGADVCATVTYREVRLCLSS